jgi:RNA polymerase sigma factor (sigma-70 family)
MEFEEFATTRLLGLLSFARVLVGDRALAEDLVQDVLIQLHQHDRLDAITNLDDYARRMVINAYTSWGRKWFRIRSTATISEPDPQPDHADVHADRDLLRRQLERLPRQQNAVLVMRYYAGLTDAEIAA